MNGEKEIKFQQTPANNSNKCNNFKKFSLEIISRWGFDVLMKRCMQIVTKRILRKEAQCGHEVHAPCAIIGIRKYRLSLIRILIGMSCNESCNRELIRKGNLTKQETYEFLRNELKAWKHYIWYQ